MSLIDTEYKLYKCPHCTGYVVVKMQFPHIDAGCFISLEHLSKFPDYLRKELEEIEE